MTYYGELRFTENTWVLDKVQPHVMIRLKKLFPKIAQTARCPISLSNTDENATDLAWFIDRYPMRTDADVKATLIDKKEKHLARLASLETIFDPTYVSRPLNLKKPLRQYQQQAVDLFRNVRRFVCGDVVGLGKTVTAIGCLHAEDALPAIVVVQTHLPSQWKEKIEEFSDLKVHVVKNGPVYQLPSSDVYIFKYTQLAKWMDVLTTGWVKTFVTDECQEFRLEDSQKYRAGRAIAGACQGAIGLSATPVYNYGGESYSVFNLIKEDCLGSKSDFLREWCDGYGGVVKDPKALGAYLRSQYLFLRRTREEVGLELPEINKIVETVDYDSKAIDAIERRARTLAHRVMQGSFIERGQAARDLDLMVRHATGVSKAKSVADYVRMIVSAGEPVLLAGWHRDVYDIWNEQLNDLQPVMYTGSETPKEKDEAKRKFIAGESDLMMISLRSGVGLDGLQERASIVVIGELDWSPMIHEQIIGRLNRDGQKHRVTVIFLVSDSGSDPGIVEVLGLKASQAAGIVDPFASAQSIDSDRSRISKLAEIFLKGKTDDKIETNTNPADLGGDPQDRTVVEE